MVNDIMSSVGSMIGSAFDTVASSFSNRSRSSSYSMGNYLWDGYTYSK